MMEQYIDRAMETAFGGSNMLFVNVPIGITFVILGIVLFRKRKSLKAMKWAGISCSVLGVCAVITNLIQYGILF